jgi:hypothetical protein
VGVNFLVFSGIVKNERLTHQGSEGGKSERTRSCAVSDGSAFRGKLDRLTCKVRRELTAELRPRGARLSGWMVGVAHRWFSDLRVVGPQVTNCSFGRKAGQIAGKRKGAG